MNKTEFLLTLQKQLSLLEDEEQKDIIDEYSQHIDMKVEKGLSEEEAIKEFGPIDQLISDILSAYHVKAPNLQDACAAPAESQQTPIVNTEKIIEGGRQAAASAAAATKKSASKLKEAARSISGRFASKDGQSSHVVDEQANEKAGIFTKLGSTISRMLSGIARGGGSLGSSILNATITLIRWCWNLLVACTAACFLACALLFVFTLGFCIVLTIQGYPLVGICLCSLGLLLAFLSISLLILKLIRRNSKRNEAEEATANNDDTQCTKPSPIDTIAQTTSSDLTAPIY